MGAITTPFASFARPADTTQYAIGDLVANNTTAGDVVPLSWFLPATGLPGTTVMIRRAVIRLSGTSITSASFRLWLYDGVSPTVANGDNGALSANSAAAFIGTLSGAALVAHSDGVVFGLEPDIGLEVYAQKGRVYGLLEARATYTPGSAETVAVRLEGAFG